jgi:hypothetical protein
MGRPAIPLARLCYWPYLRAMNRLSATPPAMIATRQPQGRLASAILWGAAALGAVITLGAAALWFHYGTAVFFEMVSAGISACF